MKIKVTQEDIDRGIRCSTAHCPIVFAIRRETGNSASVHLPVVYINGLDVADLPLSAMQFVVAFDRGQPVEPFEFEFEFEFEMEIV